MSGRGERDQNMENGGTPAPLVWRPEPEPPFKGMTSDQLAVFLAAVPAGTPVIAHYDCDCAWGDVTAARTETTGEGVYRVGLTVN